LKICFNKEGLTLNSKKFDPLNITVNGHGLESNMEISNVDPFEILESLSSSKNPEATKQDKIKALQSVISKFKY
jgi:hypothetical protein